ncbi:squamosa promoter-binding protein 1 isoform X2 [Carex littledalei]|uniref:Squamosa promoter-binding protein 1 isoform X2 n=1 Tax=Carex littledalei TaxID=544730 RepID=A0A833QUS2_9POAL|nr:squamosa promoter-binding protein 1 isoform X2 [Carex littledalei]
METEKSETPIETTTKSGTRSKPKTRNPKSKFKKSKSESASAATIIYVPVLVQNIPSDTSTTTTAKAGKSVKAAQPVLNEQQMKDWRCQADDCTADATTVGRYYQRHRICPEHSKAPSVLFNGTQQRYCQQCSRFHELTEFDGSRRSCRRQLCRRRLLRTLNTLSSEEVEQM